jgi:membrane protease YdiL (CAAX protease family)
VLHASHPEVWSLILRSPAGILLIAIFVLLDPILSWYLFRRLKNVPAERAGAMRIRIYLAITISEWLFSVLVVAVIYRYGLTLADLGQQLGNWPVSATLTVILVALIAVQVLAAGKKKKKQPADKEKIGKAIGSLMLMLPRTPRERNLFIVLGLTAGICEEFCYRGFLLTMFAGVTGSVVAGVLISSLIFSFGHIYQGKRGTLSTGVVGIVFAIIFVVTRSLIPGQILHAAVDVINGVKIGGRLAARESA